MVFKRLRPNPSGPWQLIEDTSIKRIEDPSITGDVEFDSEIWAGIYSKKATDLKELDEEKAKTIPGESNEERKIRYTKIDEQKEKILLDMYYDYIDATQLKEPSYETSEKPLSKDDEEAPALLQTEHTTSDEVNDTSLLDREVSKLKPEVNKSYLISKSTTETRADEDTPLKSEPTKSSPEYSRLEYTRMIREEKLLRNKIVEFIKSRQNYLRTSINMRSIIMALLDNGVLDIKYTTFNDEDLNMAATKAADWALLPNNKLLIAEARRKLENIEERKQKLRQQQQQLQQLPDPAPLPAPSTAGGKSITKRYNNRRKTLRRKTLRRKTLRRKTLRRKTLRRKTLRRKKYYKN